MGESTRTYVDFIKQRTRWHHSNYQIFCCGDKIPIWSTMNWLQKSYFFTFFLGTFDPLFRAIFLFTPLLSICLGISPMISTPPELVYYFVPWILLQVGSTGWATEYCGSFFWNEVYQTITCFPLLKCLIFAIRDPFGLPFKVTRKGVKAESKNYNLNSTWPLLVGIVLMVAVLGLHLVGYHAGVWQTAASSEFGMMFFLLVYNIVIMGIAILAAIDQPVRRATDRFPLQTTCQIILGDLSTYQGYTANLSETGAGIRLMTEDSVASNQPVILKFPEHGFSVKAQVRRSIHGRNYCKMGLVFTEVNLEQKRQLVNLLYTDMTWWKQSKRPRNLDVFFALVKAFLTLRPLRSKYDF
jgi:cellulose synthase (UDP-forming)